MTYLDDMTEEELHEFRKNALKRGDVVAFGEVTDFLSYPITISEDSEKEKQKAKILYRQYVEYRKKLADSQADIPKQKPIKALTGLEGKIRSYTIVNSETAEEIIHKMQWKKPYLTNLVAEITGNAKYAKSLNYRQLQKEGSIIYNLAKKSLKLKNLLR